MMGDESKGSVYREFLAERRHELLERIGAACARAGRSPEEVELLAVSKTVDIQDVKLAHEVGYNVFGENRLQELKRKVMAVREDSSLRDVTFDMIGNLQKNKINQVLDTARLVHSVSSVHLAASIGSRAAGRGSACRCLLEVNVSGEESKSGVAYADARVAAEQVMGIEGIEFCGLMCMAPAADMSAARRSFSGLRELAETLRGDTGAALPILSCGMSGDFEIAVEEGSTLVRLGRIVFDPTFVPG